MASNLITFNTVFFSYNDDGSSLLKDCSFKLTRGDRLVVKGDSGSGKTTLFRLLLGFEQPDEGEIRFKGEALNLPTLRKLRRETAWLPQDLNLGEASLQEVFYYPFEFENNISQKPDGETVRSVLESLGLQQALWETDFSNLSTGQRQRVGIALCHLLDKPLMLLDEPTSALDERSKQRVVDLLFEDNQRTILSASHDPWWIEHCSKVIELKT